VASAASKLVKRRKRWQQISTRACGDQNINDAGVNSSDSLKADIRRKRRRRQWRISNDVAWRQRGWRKLSIKGYAMAGQSDWRRKL